jgi:hypothetical protein
MIVTYCYSHPIGIALLDHASKLGCTRSQNTMTFINSGTIDPVLSRCIDGYHTTLAALKDHAISHITPYSNTSRPEPEDMKDTLSHHKIGVVQGNAKKMWHCMKKSHWNPHFNVSWAAFSKLLTFQEGLTKKLPSHFEVCLWDLILTTTY